MTLPGLVARALAAALLLGVLVLPVADHHAGSWLPGAPSLSLHRHITHHHGPGAGDRHGEDAAPLLLPLGTTGAGVPVVGPTAELPGAGVAPRLVARPLAETERAAPPGRREPPPLRPPIPPA